MSLEVDGFDDIYSTLDALGDVGKRVGKKAVRKGLNVALEQLKKDAPVDKNKSRNKLAIQHVRTNNNGSAWGSCGIGSKNWDSTQQLWFQNYGYQNFGLNFSGQRIDVNVGWIDKSFEKIEGKAEEVMMNTLGSEIDKVLR